MRLLIRSREIIHTSVGGCGAYVACDGLGEIQYSGLGGKFKGYH